jgi:hypothetical protein
MHIPAVELFLAEGHARGMTSVSGEAIQLARHFGFDLVEKLLGPGVTGTAVEGEHQCQKDQRSAFNTSISPLQHSPPRYPQARA